MARGGIEPPQPAFSGLLTDSSEWFRIRAIACVRKSYERPPLGLIGMIWAIFALRCSPIVPATRRGSVFMRAAISARVSKADGRQDVDNQVSELRRFAITQG